MLKVSWSSFYKRNCFISWNGFLKSTESTDDNFHAVHRSVHRTMPWITAFQGRHVMQSDFRGRYIGNWLKCWWDSNLFRWSRKRKFIFTKFIKIDISLQIRIFPIICQWMWYDSIDTNDDSIRTSKLISNHCLLIWIEKHITKGSIFGLQQSFTVWLL